MKNLLSRVALIALLALSTIAMADTGSVLRFNATQL